MTHLPCTISHGADVLALYLFCLVLGGGFLAVSLLGGGEGGDLDVDADLDLDGDVDAHHDTAASRIFSFRTLVYGLFGFGATGAALTALGTGTLVALVFALTGGVAAGVLVGALFNWLRRTESGAMLGDAELVGLTGSVLLPLSATTPGTVAVERGGRRLTLRALPHAQTEADPESWTAVVIVGVESGIARVAPLAPGELDLLPSPNER